MRKFVIGIVSLAIVIGVFVLYSRIDKTPPINTNPRQEYVSNQEDSNAGDTGTIGKISTPGGDIGIGTAENFSYITRNKKGEIEREFGFQKLLHTEGDIWELEKPYMNIYHDDFTCYMKADQGVVQVDKIGDKTIPKDATFSGNVVVNILSGRSGSIEESAIYLENLAFISEKSQLSTTGNLQFFSKTVQLSGAGMELIYNDEQERLEFFRIADLDTLNVKIRRATLGTTSRTVQSSKENRGEEKTGQSAVIVNSQKPSQDKSYTCLFSKNVLIDTPDQRVFAASEIQIDDIIWSHEIEDENAPGESAPENDPNKLNNVASEPNKAEKPPEELVDVVITCDNGLIITPKDSGKINEFKNPAQTITDIEKPEFEDAVEKNTLITQKIQLTTLEGDSIATGPTELTFYVEDLNVPDPNLRSFPVTITSRKGAKFIKAANQVVFEGDSLCRIPQKNLGREKYAAFSSPMLIINLPKSRPEQVSSLSDIIAIGPAELVFYIPDSNAATEEQKIIPVKITAKEKALYLPAMKQVIFDKDCLCQVGSEETGKEQFVSLKSSNLKIELPKENSAQSFAFSDITAAGPVDLKFFMKDPNNMGTPQSLLPINITARKQARYLSSSRQIIVDGSCRSSMLRQDADFIQELALLSDKIIVDLPEDINEQSPTSSLTGIRHLNADGDKVELTVAKKSKAGVIGNNSPNQILGWTKLISKSLDYDTQEQIFQVTGPGQLTLSDTEIKDSKEQGGRSILGKKWIADANGFSSLKYLLNNNRIIASSEPNKMISVQYIEMDNDEYSPVLMATAGHVEIRLNETGEGKLEPSIVVASGGIDYQKDENNRFLGSVLIYDHKKSTITIHGDEKNPVYNNGVLADEIFIDLTNNNVKVTSSGPSSF